MEIKRLGDFEGVDTLSEDNFESQGFFSAKPQIKLNMELVGETQEEQ